MGRTQVTGIQISDGTIQSIDIEDGSVKRSDLNTTSTGEAVITKVIAGTNITIDSTGVDIGTGDVTINATGGGSSNVDDGTVTGQMLFWSGVIWTYTDIAELFWDNINKRLGVGTNTPNALLEINGEARLSDASDMGSNDASLATKKYVDDNASGMNESEHRELDQLVHSISENYYQEIIRSGNKITDIIWWTDVSKTTKIREENLTRFVNKVITQETKQYDETGTLAETFTESYTYSGNKVISVTGVLS